MYPHIGHLSIQVVSYLGETRLEYKGASTIAVNKGRCIVCSCSTFRHSLSPASQCRQCPTNDTRIYKSADLAGLHLPQFCSPALPNLRSKGPARFELCDEMGETLSMEAPIITYPRLTGAFRPNSSRPLLYRMQDERCNGCFAKKPYADLTFDHRLAKSLDGLRTMQNAELMCSDCNGAKGSRDMAAFLWERWGPMLRHLHHPSLPSV